MKFFFIIFFIIIIGFQAATHYLVYAGLTRWLDINSQAGRTMLGVSLVFLAISFVAASALARYFSGAAVKYYYLLAAVWEGLIVYLLLSFGIIWLISYISQSLGWAINIKLLAAVFIALAFMTTGYGVWNARRPIVKRITVPIKNLPVDWRDRKAVLISDLHLGILLGTDFMDKIAGLINNEQPDMLFITGDYFDGTCPNYKALAEPLKFVEPPLGKYFALGNHETYLNNEEALKSLEQAGVKVLRDEIVDIGGMFIVGADYPQAGSKNNIEELLTQVDKEKPSILLYHEPRFIKLAQASGIDLQLAGHIHGGQFFPINLITRLIYGKYHYGLHRKDNYAIYTTSGAGTWGPPLRIGARAEIVVISFKSDE